MTTKLYYLLLSISAVLICSNASADSASGILSKTGTKGGTIACAGADDQEPIQVFDGVSYQGASSTVEAFTVYSGDAIPNGLNKKISSLILKKGYQVCIATKEKGQGLSKMLIAVKRDIRIPKLSSHFNDAITFLRVTPFRNVAKRGHCGNPDPRFNAAWFYTWGGTKESTENLLWTPMIFPKKKAGEWTTDLVNRTDIQEVIGFNEPDSPEGWRVVKPDYAVRLLQNALSVGIRMGSPSPRESGPRKWLPEFMEAAKSQNLRVDFLCLHWYDRQAARKAKNRNDSGEEVFDRFKTYMTTVYEKYGLPIWLTEFNANPSRNNTVQRKFLELAMAWMDTTPWMERYAYFQPIPIPDESYREDIALDLKKDVGELTKHEIKMRYPGTGDFTIKAHFDPERPLTELGKYWSNFKAAPYLSKDVYLGKNNLCEDEVEETMEPAQ